VGLLLCSLSSCGYSWTEFFVSQSESGDYSLSVSVGRRWYLIFEKIVLKILVRSPTRGEATIFMGADEQHNVPSHPCSPRRLGILWLEDHSILAIRMDCELGEDFDRVFDLEGWRPITEKAAIDGLRLDGQDSPWQWEDLRLPPR
jgi:hypothetical protein